MSKLAACVALSLLVCMVPSVGNSRNMPVRNAQPFPSYGSGKVTVRLYTDYLCAPCRAMEPSLEPLISDLVKRNIVQLTFVDTPIYPASAVYTRYFLYALKKRNDFEHALRVRAVLFRAAEEKVVEKEKLESSLKKSGIEWVPFDPRSILQRFDAYIKEDKIGSTPRTVVINGEKKATYKGSRDIISALQLLK